MSKHQGASGPSKSGGSEGHSKDQSHSDSLFGASTVNGHAMTSVIFKDKNDKDAAA